MFSLGLLTANSFVLVASRQLILKSDPLKHILLLRNKCEKLCWSKTYIYQVDVMKLRGLKGLENTIETMKEGFYKRHARNLYNAACKLYKEGNKKSALTLRDYWFSSGIEARNTLRATRKWKEYPAAYAIRKEALEKFKERDYSSCINLLEHPPRKKNDGLCWLFGHNEVTVRPSTTYFYDVCRVCGYSKQPQHYKFKQHQ